MSPLETSLDRAFREHERFLRGLCYRMTGSAADAEDLVQQTFARALEAPPARLDEPWRPWLVRVAVNLARDQLRARKRRAYEGPWLPSPIETDDEAWSLAEPLATEGRYELLESVSFAFLVALEALTPRERAVLLLRDVFDYSVRETADALGLSEPNVKTTHHRARRAMEPYDAARTPFGPALQERTAQALQTFLIALTTGDTAAVEALLTDSVRTVNDGAGEYYAARVPVVGRAKVALFHTKIAAQRAYRSGRFAMRMVNGLPALIAEYDGVPPDVAGKLVLLCDIDAAGAIRAIYTVLATEKLRGIRPAA